MYKRQVLGVIGGNAGLLTGVSVMTVAEIIEFLLIALGTYTCVARCWMSGERQEVKPRDNWLDEGPWSPRSSGSRQRHTAQPGAVAGAGEGGPELPVEVSLGRMETPPAELSKDTI